MSHRHVSNLHASERTSDLKFSVRTRQKETYLFFCVFFRQERTKERTPHSNMDYVVDCLVAMRPCYEWFGVFCVSCFFSETPVINLTSLADPCHTTLPPHVVRAGCRRVVPSSGANGSNGLQCHHHCLYPRHNCFFKCVKGDADRRNAQFL